MQPLGPAVGVLLFGIVFYGAILFCVIKFVMAVTRMSNTFAEMSATLADIAATMRHNAGR